jgi:hypothetical protein
MKIEKCISPRYTVNGYRGGTGYFYTGWTDGTSKSFYSKEELENHKTNIKTILDNKGNGKIGKTLYVGKGSNAPRHKVKLFVEENKIKKTTIIENSDTVIFDKKIIQDVYKWFDQCKEVKIAVVPFSQQILDIIVDLNNQTNQTNYIKQYTDFYKKQYTFTIYDNEYVNYPSEFKQALGNIEWVDCYEQHTYRTKNIQDIFDTLQYYFKNPHGNIIWDDEILETLNSEGIDLDEDYVNTLDSMFSSNEPDNIRLAVEMMSNVNLNKYGLTIALLLNKYSHSMGWGNGNTGSQAYKTLDRYFLNKGIDWKRDYRLFSAGLYKNYSDSPIAKEIIEQFVLQNINRHLAENGFGHKGCMLQIDSFKISLHNKK